MNERRSEVYFIFLGGGGVGSGGGGGGAGVGSGGGGSGGDRVGEGVRLDVNAILGVGVMAGF